MSYCRKPNVVIDNTAFFIGITRQLAITIVNYLSHARAFRVELRYKRERASFTATQNLLATQGRATTDTLEDEGNNCIHCDALDPELNRQVLGGRW